MHVADLADEHAAILVLVEPALATLDTVCEQIKVLDDEIAKLAAARYPQVELLTGIAGVGVLTLSCLVLVVGHHEKVNVSVPAIPQFDRGQSQRYRFGFTPIFFR